MKRLQLKDLKIKSFSTSTQENITQTIKGGVHVDSPSSGTFLGWWC